MASERENGGVRQAAILMASVDSQTARTLLQQMPPAMAKAVRRAMVDLGRIDAEEQRAVLAAFKSRVQPTKAKPTPTTTSAQFAASSQTSSLQTSSTASAFASSGTSPTLSPDFFANQVQAKYWESYTADQIIEVVSIERPTVIAVVLTQLQPIVANQVLGKLPSELRKEVLVQLSRLQQVEAEIIEEIKEQLQRKLALTRPMPSVDHELGMTRLKSILEAGDEQMKIELCQAMQETSEITGPLRYWVKEQLNNQAKALGQDSNVRDTIMIGESAATTPAASAITDAAKSNQAQPSPSAKQSTVSKGESLHYSNAKNSGHSNEQFLTPNSGEAFDTAHSYVDFEDLKWIGLNQLAMILQNCDPRALLVALSTADEELLKRVALLFSKKDWKRLNERLRELGPVDDEDRLAARMIVAESAQRLLIGEDLQNISKPTSNGYARAA